MQTGVFDAAFAIQVGIELSDELLKQASMISQNSNIGHSYSLIVESLLTTGQFVAIGD
jgi:hypothetical protein